MDGTLIQRIPTKYKRRKTTNTHVEISSEEDEDGTIAYSIKSDTPFQYTKESILEWAHIYQEDDNGLNTPNIWTGIIRTELQYPVGERSKWYTQLKQIGTKTCTAADVDLLLYFTTQSLRSRGLPTDLWGPPSPSFIIPTENSTVYKTCAIVFNIDIYKDLTEDIILGEDAFNTRSTAETFNTQGSINEIQFEGHKVDNPKGGFKRKAKRASYAENSKKLVDICRAHKLYSKELFEEACSKDSEVRALYELMGMNMNWPRILGRAIEMTRHDIQYMSYEMRYDKGTFDGPVVSALDFSKALQLYHAAMAWIIAQSLRADKMRANTMTGTEREVFDKMRVARNFEIRISPFEKIFKTLMGKNGKRRSLFFYGAASSGKTALMKILVACYEPFEIGAIGSGDDKSSFWLSNLPGKSIYFGDEFTVKKYNVDTVKMLLAGDQLLETDVKHSSKATIPTRPIILASNNPLGSEVTQLDRVALATRVLALPVGAVIEHDNIHGNADLTAAHTYLDEPHILRGALFFLWERNKIGLKRKADLSKDKTLTA